MSDHDDMKGALAAIAARTKEWRAWLDAVGRLADTGRSLMARVRDVVDSEGSGQEFAVLLEEGLLEVRESLRDALEVTPEAVEWLHMVRAVDDALDDLKAMGAGRGPVDSALGAIEREAQRVFALWLDVILAPPQSADFERRTRSLERAQRVLQKIIDDVVLPRLLERGSTQSD
ncbi:MAG: hypothetical protein AAGI01_10570 [Myxococcota bacterium]